MAPRRTPAKPSSRKVARDRVPNYGGEVDWALIRREWETTTISGRALAKRHGIDPSSVRYRIDRESWTRDKAANAAAIAAAAAGVAPPTRVGETAGESGDSADGLSTRPGEKYNPESSPERSARVEGGGQADLYPPKAESNQPAEAAQGVDSPHYPEESTRRVESEGKTRLKPRDLAAMHAAEIRMNLEVGMRVIEVGRGILERLHVIAYSTNEAELHNAVRRILLNPKADNLHATLDACARILTMGIGVRRRALGLDPVKGAGGNGIPAVGDPEGAGLSDEVRAVIERADPDLLMKMREVAVNITRLPRRPPMALKWGPLIETEDEVECQS